MTATDSTDDGGEERSDQINSHMAAMLTYRTVMIVEDIHSRALGIEKRVEDGDPEALGDIADLIEEASDDLAVLHGLVEEFDP